MNDKMTVNDTASLKKLFQTDKNINSPYIYFPMNMENGQDSRTKITKLLTGYKKSGFIGIIPFSNKDYPAVPLSPAYYETYSFLREGCTSASLSLGYLDDTYVMREYLSKAEQPAALNCKILCKYEYSCTEGVPIKKQLHTTGPLMSLVAVNDDDMTILDLRPHVTNGVLEWEVPAGNWNVEEYVCEPDVNTFYVDMMDYEICSEYLKKTFGTLLQKLHQPEPLSALKKEEASPVDLFIYRNIQFAGQNRRMWSPMFNKVFEETYGFDPSPYYTLLFRDYPIYSQRYKYMLMACRSRMLVDGYLKAASDFCKARSIFCTGFPAEGKATACSWLFGDGQLLHRYASAPGISMPFAYMYGINGIRVASSAADLMGVDVVTADLFNYFSTLTRDIIYREAMSVYVRGVNMIFAHLGEDRTKENSDIVENDLTSWGSIFSKGDDLTDFATFATRVQTMLRGGEHISEAAIVYPIQMLHAQAFLYQSDNTGFEYPSTPENADYMGVMNDFLSYVGIDTIFLHPDLISERAFAENGILYLDNDKNNRIMKFKLLVLPAMTIISLKTLRMIKKFFNEGGKIIATTSLPLNACESSAVYPDVNTALKTETAEDLEVRETIEYIFGKDVTDTRLYKRYYKNTNEKGGAAYYFPSNKTTANRIEAVSPHILYQAAANFGLAPDVYIDKMPRREFLGILSFNLPDFMKVGIDKRLVKGCSMNYIHKKYASCDIYYFTNTSGDQYAGNILLKGRHIPEEWNPYTGKIRKLTSSLARFRGEIYTVVEMTIEASACTFIVSPDPKSPKDALPEVADEGLIPEFFAHENF